MGDACARDVAAAVESVTRYSCKILSPSLLGQLQTLFLVFSCPKQGNVPAANNMRCKMELGFDF
jgi:hypothetical protein